MASTPKGHSEEYFGDCRDFWWNRDFLDLMARRWDLSSSSTMLDVGSGLCHWSLLLAPYLDPPAAVTALDSDPKWAQGNEDIKERFQSLSSTVVFREGDARRLPFPDNSFDIVTCQTVLIHCPEAGAALQEMKRVVKEGGIVICAEPNNLVGSTSFDSNELANDVNILVERFRERLLYERGRQVLGEGNISLGDQLPFLFSQTGLVDIKSYISDRINPLFPPYATPAQQADISLALELADPEQRQYANEQNRRYATALNSPADLEFIRRRQDQSEYELREMIRAINDERYYAAGLSVMYLVSGRKKVI